MGAMTDTTTLLTFEEFEQLPDTPGKLELLRGELIELPVPEFYHGALLHRTFRLLDAALNEARARGEAIELGDVYIEIGYKLGKRSYVRPDVSITHAGQAIHKYLEGAPAIAIEVISPSNTAAAMDSKTELYFEFGAREVWQFYPRTRHVVIRVAGSSQAVIERVAVRTSLLPGFELNVQGIFAN